MLEPDAQQNLIRLAQEQPNMRCSEAPVEILQASAYAGEEPTPFLKDFFAAGFVQRLSEIFGRRMDFDQEIIDRAVYLLWYRACGLYTSHLTGRPDPDWDQLFFSDEDLYD
jgi:hypothetical protein